MPLPPRKPNPTPRALEPETPPELAPNWRRTHRLPAMIGNILALPIPLSTPKG
jgi:hypothetical protein